MERVLDSDTLVYFCIKYFNYLMLHCNIIRNTKTNRKQIKLLVQVNGLKMFICLFEQSRF